MAETQDECAARRWFRQRLADLKAQYPQLTTPAAQERLATYLDTPQEETDHGPTTDRQAPRPPRRQRHVRRAHAVDGTHSDPTL